MARTTALAGDGSLEFSLSAPGIRLPAGPRRNLPLLSLDPPDPFRKGCHALAEMFDGGHHQVFVGFLLSFC